MSVSRFSTSNPQEPIKAYYRIDEASRLVDVTHATLRYWEQVGIVKPKRSRAGKRIYSHSEILKLQRARDLIRVEGFTVRSCLCCGKPFEVRRREHVYCSDNCRWRHKGKRNPEALTKSRQRCAEWARVNRNVRGENRWLRAAPPFGEHLPGAGFTLDVSPQPKWPVVHRNIRGVHGMVTELLGVGHHETMPVFTLMPTGFGLRWAAFVADESVARRVAGRPHAGVLYDREVTIRCGHLTRVRSPKIVKRGHRKLRIDALTPVQIRNTTGRKSDNPRVTVHSMPTSGNLCSTMALMLARRLGVELREDDIALKIYERHCQFRTVQLGDKFGNVGGFVGHMIIDTNATGHWLLKCAETLGLGGRTAFGMGRIRVTEVA